MSNSQKIVKDIAVIVGLFVVYVIAGKLGLKLAFVNASATAVWPPTGIAIAALLILGYRFWPIILLGAFFVNFTTSGGIATSLGIALGNTLEALFGAYLIGRFAQGRRVFDHPENVFKFAFFVGLIATAVSATIGSTTLLLGHLTTTAEYSSVWLTWWLGDIGGALIIAPFLILWASEKFVQWKKIKILEFVIFLVFFITVCQLVFGGIEVFGSRNNPLDFLFIPLLLWAVFRFKKIEVSTIILVLSSLAIRGTLYGSGPFIRANSNESLLFLQGFLVIASIGSLAVSSLIQQQSQLEDELIDYSQDLAKEKTRADALLASIGEGLIATDKAGEITTVNKAFEDLLGWEAAELIGRPSSQVLEMEDEHGKKIPEKHRPLTLALNMGQKITATHYIYRKDNTKFPAAITATPLLLDNKIIGAIKIFRDVTLEKQIDKAKTEFVSLASHQLRTPLTIVKWQASRLIEDFDNAKDKAGLLEFKKQAENIYTTNQRMIELVNAILNVSKIDLGTLAVDSKPSSLTEIADKLLEEFGPEISIKQLQFSKVYEPNLPLVKVDPKLMRIVLQNLLTNSIKYTSPGGRVALKISLGDSEILLTVSDTGCGISALDQTKIFSKFFRTESARHIDPNGNGLGMYILKSIIDETGGQVWFESQVDKGTTFYVTLPLTGMKSRPGVKDLTESYS